MPVVSHDGRYPIIEPKSFKKRRQSIGHPPGLKPLTGVSNSYREVTSLRDVAVLTKPPERPTHRYSLNDTDHEIPYRKSSGEKLLPRDYLYSQEAMYEFERQPSAEDMRAVIVKIAPQAQSNLHSKVATDARFDNPEGSVQTINAMSLGKRMAISTNMRQARRGNSRHRKKLADDEVEDKLVTSVRPLVSDVGRYRSKDYIDHTGHQHNNRCGELGSLDMHLRERRYRRYSRSRSGERGRRYRDYSETGGWDRQLRDTFRDRDASSISYNLMPGKPEKERWMVGCSPYEKKKLKPGSTGCFHTLHHDFGVDDVIRTDNDRQSAISYYSDGSLDRKLRRLNLR